MAENFPSLLFYLQHHTRKIVLVVCKHYRFLYYYWLLYCVIFCEVLSISGFFFFFKTMDLPYGLSGFNFYLIFEIGSHISQNLIIWARMTLNLLCFCVLDAGIVGLCYGIWFYMVLELEPSTVCIHSESHQHGLHPQSSCGP